MNKSVVFIMIFFCFLLVGCSENQDDIWIVDEENNLEVKKFELIREIDLDNRQLMAHEILYESEELNISGFEVRPRNINNKKYPLIIFNRGGNNDFGAISDEMLKYIFSMYAEEDYVVLASQYRGTHTEGKDEFGGSDINDVSSLIDIAYNLKYIDTDRIYMLGFSRGSIMTLQMLKDRDDIKAAATIGTISDLQKTYASREYAMKSVLIDCIGGNPEKIPSEYKRRSAINWVQEIDTPLLILHGENDKRVSVTQAIDFKEELDRLDKTSKLIIYDNDDHSLEVNYFEAVHEVLTWFNTY